MKSSHAAVSTRREFNHCVWFGFIVDEKRGKQESLNHYRIIMNVADQNALQEQLHNNHKVDSVEKQRNSTMKYSALSNEEHEQILSSHSHLLSTCFYRWKLWRNIMAIAKPGQVQIRHTFLMKRVWVQEWLWTNSQSKKSQSNIFMTSVKSSVKVEVGKNPNKMTSHCFSGDMRLQLLSS